MNMIEVKANLSFDGYRQGKHYQVDADDPRVQAHIAGGYLKPGGSDGMVATDSPGLVPDTGVDIGMAGQKRRAKKKVTDGQGQDRPAESEHVHPPGDVATGFENS